MQISNLIINSFNSFNFRCTIYQQPCSLACSSFFLSSLHARMQISNVFSWFFLKPFVCRMDVLFWIICVFCLPWHCSFNAPFASSMHWKIHGFYVLKFIHICCRLYFSHIIRKDTHILSTNDAAINNTRENGVDDKNVHFVMYIIKFFVCTYFVLCFSNFSIYDITHYIFRYGSLWQQNSLNILRAEIFTLNQFRGQRGEGRGSEKNASSKWSFNVHSTNKTFNVKWRHILLIAAEFSYRSLFKMAKQKENQMQNKRLGFYAYWCASENLHWWWSRSFEVYCRSIKYVECIVWIFSIHLHVFMYEIAI